MLRNSIGTIVAAAALFSLGCSKPAPPTDGGCGSDNDCKGDRICQDRRCVTPTAQVAPARPAKPVSPIKPVDPVKPAPAQEVKPSTPTPPNPASNGPTKPASAADVLKKPASIGASDPLVVITEFGDFQCPYCEQSRGVLRAILQEYGRPDGTVRVEWRHNPLAIHPEAERLARAASAAHVQGRFWHLHDAMFNAPDALNEANLRRLARAAAIDEKRWSGDRQLTVVKERVESDRRIARALGVAGTPAFFVNGKLLAGLQSQAALKVAIEAELTAARALHAKQPKNGGTPAESIPVMRQRANNPDFARYLVDGVEPPEVARKTLPVDDTVWKITVTGEEPQLGDKDALVTIVEFANFECPFCARYAPVLRTLVESENAAEKGSVRLIYKHNPLPVHRRSGPAAHAAIEAHAQGKFWEYHDALYAQAGQLKGSDFSGVANGLGLDGRRVHSATSDQRHGHVIAADQQLATSVGAIGTPNLFINGRKVVGLRSLDELRQLVNQAKTVAKARVAASTPRDALYATYVTEGKSNQVLVPSKTALDLPGAPTRGPAEAVVDLVFFGDFQCPFSRNLVPIVERVTHRVKDRVRLRFAHFPMAHHARAEATARYSVCAEKQGKFWEFYSLVFAPENQRDLSNAALAKHAATLGLDGAKLTACVKAPATAAKVAADRATGVAAGVKGTPTLFINGRRFNSPTGYNDKSLSLVLARLLKKP
jgi:protein-disulfide isomerase